MKVDLPEPDGPITITISPAQTLSAMPRRADTTWSPMWYVLRRSATSMTGVPSRSGGRIGSGAGPPSLGGRPSRVGASDGLTRVGASDGSMLACVIDTVLLPSATTAGLRGGRLLLAAATATTRLRPEQAGPTALRRRDRLAGDDL